MGTVVISTAGLGTRLGTKTKLRNKSLLSLNCKPIIAHQIEKFDHDQHILILLGYLGDQVKECVETIFPKRNITFQRIKNYRGKGSGLTQTFLEAKESIKNNFIFLACDTLVKEKIVFRNENCLGISEVAQSINYRTVVKDKLNNIIDIEEKNKENKTSFAYIGLCEIFDYEVFWNSFENINKSDLETGETIGLRNLIKNQLTAIEYTWFDTGNPLALNKAKKEFIKKKLDFNILEKETEDIWFVDKKVIKFCTDKSFIRDRTKRAKLLSPNVPEIISHGDYTYSYKFLEGVVFSEVGNHEHFLYFLEFFESFWSKATKKKQLEKSKFNKLTHSFYKEKTINRVEKSNKKFNLNKFFVNDEFIDVKANIEKVDWELIIQKSIPGLFHGDFHWENIIFNKSLNTFKLIDWRQDYSGCTNAGDLYYDAAKFLHGLIIKHAHIKNELYCFEEHEDNRFKIKIPMDKFQTKCLSSYEEWIYKNNLDKNHIYLLCSLVYINIAVLHHDPYSKFLWCLGNLLLKRYLDGEWVKENDIIHI